jgi:hypothetical protein
LELLGESELVDAKELIPIKNETNELLAIFVSIVNKTKLRGKNAKP